MTNPRSELADWAKPPKAAVKRHVWRDTIKRPNYRASVCTECGCKRVTTATDASWPTSRYTTAQGLIVNGKAPECAREIEHEHTM